MSLVFNVTVNDNVGGYGSYAQLIRTDLVYAGSVWANYINSNASIEVEVDIAPTAIHTADGTAATSVFLQTQNGNNYFEFGTIAEMLTGQDPNGSAPDAIIHIDPQFIDQFLYFDPYPTPTSNVPSNKTDAVEAFEHELGHAFGFNGFRNLSTGASQGSLSTYDVFVTTIDGTQYFTGPEAEAVYGGPVPLTTNNFYHVGNPAGSGHPGSDLLNDMMNGVVGFLGKGPGPSALDLAILADAGVPMRADYVFAPATFELAAFNPGNGWTSDNQFHRELADVNGDHMADIIGFGNGGVYVSLATGGGNFASPAITLAALNPANGWTSQDQFPRELADVNGDGLADIVAFGNGGVYVSLATGGGNFAAQAVTLAAFNPGNGWTSQDQFPRELADVNGDHMADIVAFGNGGVYVALATGGGNFGPATIKLAALNPGNGWTSQDQFPRELADVNGDGMADIVGFGNGGAYVALATGGGNFATPIIGVAALNPGNGWTSNNQFPRELADINHDGMADIVGFGNGGVYVAAATGGGHFASPVVDIAAFNPANGWSSDDQFHHALADVNHDGFADIVGFGNPGVLVALANDFHLI